MKNFVKLIKEVHEKRLSVVKKKLIDQKIPVATISINPTAVEETKAFRAQGFNVTTHLVINNPPPNFQTDNLDFNVVQISKARDMSLPIEYIFAPGDVHCGIAQKYFPSAQILDIKNVSVNGTEAFYKAFMTHLPELQEVYESLIDEESKKTFRGFWLGNISGQLGEFVFANTPHYICAGFIPEEGDIVIDGGVCDGGTTARFTQMGYKVYGFEMDKANYEMSRKVAEENHFVLENLGLGSFNHTMTYTHMSNPGASRIDAKGTETAQIVTLDSYVREKRLPYVDMIKLDVEGAELDVLSGAATTIARFKPILALSAYHKVDDFWTLMNFVKSIRPDYEFAMRQFVISREDGAYHFNENTEKMRYSFGLRPALLTRGECVLFAR